MSYKFAKLIYNRVAYGLELAWDVVERYFVYLAKTLIRFGIGCVLTAMFLYCTLEYKSPIFSMLTVFTLASSVILLYTVSLPAKFGLNLAMERWEVVRREIYGLADIIFSTVLALFFMIGNRLYENPSLFLGFMAVLTLFFAATLLPKSPLVGSFYGRSKYVIPVMALTVTIWQQVHSGKSVREIIDSWTDRSSEISSLRGQLSNQEKATAEANQQAQEAKLEAQRAEEKRLETIKRQQETQLHEESRRKEESDQRIQRELDRQRDEEQRNKLAEETGAFRQRLEDQNRLIASLSAEQLLKNSAWPPEGFSAEGHRQFENGKELILVESVLLQRDMTGQPDDELVYAQPVRPLRYNGRTFNDLDQTVFKMKIASVKDGKEKNTYAIEVAPQAIIVLNSLGHRAQPDTEISGLSDSIKLTVKKAGNSALRSLLGTLVGAGTGALGGVIIGGKEGAKRGAIIGAAGGAIVGYKMKSHGKELAIPSGQKVAFLIRK